MAGDWIKMRTALSSSPKVVRILSACNADGCPHQIARHAVIGALHAAWAIADAHTEDGKLEGYTLETLDSALAWPGFSAAMEKVGWLKETTQGLVFPDFEEHNGRSAKRRALESARKKGARKTSA